MSILTKYFKKYYEDYELPVIPLSGKRPIIKDWSKFCSQMPTEEEVSGWSINNNIGLCLGPESGIIALDIDTDDKETLKKCPQSPVVKRGKKGETRLFKYNGEEAIKRHDLSIEVLSLGNQTVMPPSIHPDTKKPYTFTTFNLYPDHWDELPDLNNDFYQSLLEKDGESRNSEIIPSDGSRCNHNSYNKISEMLVAALYSGKTPEIIVEELLEYDSMINEEVSLFICSSQKWKGYDRISNCYFFVLDAFKRAKVEIKKPQQIEIIESVEGHKRETYKTHKLPKMDGIMKVMFDHIYETSPVPRSAFASASVLATMGTILGNKVCFEGIHTNLYIGMFAPSGFGKDTPIKFPKEVFKAARCKELIGEGAPSSDAGILIELGKKRVRLDSIDEAATLFGSISSSKESYHKKMADVYATLYSSPGSEYEGKNTAKNVSKENLSGNTGACFSPCVSMLATMTIVDFQNTFTLNTIEKGLGARFLYFGDREHKRARRITPKKIPDEIINYVRRIRMNNALEDNIDYDPFSDPKPVNLGIHDEADRRLNEILEEIEDIKEKKKEGDRLFSLYNRLYVNIVKIAMIRACGSQWDEPLSSIKIKLSDVQYAYNYMMANTKNTEIFFELNLSINFIEKNVNTVERIIKDSGPKGIAESILAKEIKQKIGVIWKPDGVKLVEHLLQEEKILRSGKVRKKYFHEKFLNEARLKI